MRDSKSGSVEAIERAIQILDSFSIDRPELGVADISRALGLKRSTVHRALATMEAGGILKQDPVTQKYALGTKVLKLAHVLQSQFSVGAVALPRMKALRDRVNETVALHLLEGSTRVVVQQVESTHDVRRTYHEIGKPLPLHVGSSGKAILAFLPPEEIRKVLAERGADSTAGRGPTNVELAEQLEEVRREGYAVTVGERTDGISSISCPIFDGRGRCVGCINISGPAARFPIARAVECAPALQEVSRAVSRELGWNG
jgi:IclR family acetate operon transcriptional repressor